MLRSIPYPHFPTNYQAPEPCGACHRLISPAPLQTHNLMSGLMNWFLAKAQTAYARITISRLGVLFILLSCIHCLAQGAIQVALLRSDAGQKDMFYRVMQVSNISIAEIPWLRHFGHDDFELDVCSQFPLPGINTTAVCKTLVRTPHRKAKAMVPSRSTLDELKLNNTISHLSPNVTRRSLDVVSIVPMLNTGRIEGAKLSYDHGAQDVILSETCSRSLILAGDVFSSFYYEDVILLAAQFWLMVISVVAVIYRSIPQILAINCARVLMTGWEIYATWRITSYGHTFSLLYVAQGTPCQFNFFSDFWTRRMALTIPNLILNITAFGFESLIGRHLIKTFTLYTFQRAAPSASVLRIYRYFLAVFVFLQLDIFYLLSMMGLWITWLDEGVGKIATYETLYKALFFTTIITVLPWLAMGWYAVRREMRKTFAVWLIMGSVYLICWTLMFYSYSFRWTFLYWEFFACLTCTSYIVLIATGIAGVICRLNFGKGLAHYLHVEEVLAKSGFAAGIFENDMEQLQSPQKSAAIETARTTDARPHGEGGESDVAMGPIIVIQGNSAM